MTSEQSAKLKKEFIYRRWVALSERMGTIGNVVNFDFVNVDLFESEARKVTDDLQKLIEDTREVIQ